MIIQGSTIGKDYLLILKFNRDHELKVLELLDRDRFVKLDPNLRINDNAFVPKTGTPFSEMNKLYRTLNDNDFDVPVTHLMNWKRVDQFILFINYEEYQSAIPNHEIAIKTIPAIPWEGFYEPIIIKDNHIPIHTDQIIFIRSQGVTSCIHLKDKSFEFRKPVVDLIAEISDPFLMRISNDIAVNLRYLHAFDKNALYLKYSENIIRIFFLKKNTSERSVSFLNGTNTCPEASSLLNTPNDDWLDYIIELVQEQLKVNTISIELIAEKLGMSTRHFQRKFSELTGMSPQSFIKDFRLEMARKMITESPEKDIASIASEICYNDVYYFKRIFKEKYGYLPEEKDI